MSTNEQTPLSQPTSAVTNMIGREEAPQNLKKLKAVKTRLNFEEASQYSESETPNRRRNLKERLGPRARSGSPEQRRSRSKSPREKGPKRRMVFKRLEKDVFHRLGDKEKNVSAHSRGLERKSYYSSRRDTKSCYQSSRSKETKIAFEKHRHKREYSRRTKAVSENPFTPRIRYFDFPKTPMPSHIKTYDESEDPEDHLKIFQAAAKTERWAMPTWCHMLNSTLTENARVWFDDLPKESIDSYDDLRKAFLENYLQQKKCIKDPVEIHNIKQRNGESTKEFVRRYKLECRDANRRNAKGRETLTFDQGVKAKPQKRLGKDSKKGGNLGKRQTAGNINGAAMAKDSKAKDHSNFLPGIKIKNQLIPANTPLVGFSGEIIWPLGQISLLVRVGDEEHSTSAQMNFMVVRTPSPYNGIIGRPGLENVPGFQGLKQIMPQIWLSVTENRLEEEDEEKTAFITSQGIFCYSKMLFGLKNVGATYQRLVDKAFQKQIGRNLEVYVDDLVIKSRTEKEVIRDAEETFKTLRKINMKLNPKKCAFGMREGTFLGYKVDADGLRVSPDKVKAVLDLPSPKCLKDVQKLNGKLASLNRFLSKSAEKSLPFFKTLKKYTKKSDFQWTPKAEGAFKEMKQSIAELLMLTAPKEKEDLIIYLAAAKEAISAVLMTERDEKQVPIYFVSRALQGPKINYTPMEKLILTLISAREHDIQYRPRTSVKGQILADFIVDRPEDGAPDTPMEDSATNNEAEYEAIIAGLRIASQMGIQNLQENVDSKLVANQVNGIYIAKESSMIRYLEKVKNLANTFKGFSIKQIPRGENKKANVLSKIASTSFAHLSKRVLVEELREKAIDEKEILAVVKEEGHTWVTSVYEYLTEGVLPEEKKKARTIRRKAGRYVVINEVLYKKSFLGPWLRCVGPLQANYVLREIHEGSCSMHAGPRSVVAKALRSSYFWPTMHADAKNLIRELIPTEIGMPTLRNAEVDMAKNNEALGISLDLLEEKREQATIQEARNKAKMEGYYNARVRSTNFRPRDFVYRNNEASHAEDGGKLEPKWEGPYELTEALGKGAYRLRDRNGHTLTRTWNIRNLKMCYMHEM
nr:reverse transcriptase domain-containing protein [Tanacetum cinerariifolium]